MIRARVLFTIGMNALHWLVSLATFCWISPSEISHHYHRYHDDNDRHHHKSYCYYDHHHPPIQVQLDRLPREDDGPITRAAQVIICTL